MQVSIAYPGIAMGALGEVHPGYKGLAGRLAGTPLGMGAHNPGTRVGNPVPGRYLGWETHFHFRPNPKRGNIRGF